MPMWLRRVNPLTAFLVVLGVVVVGMLLPGVPGALILLVLVGALAALLGLTWSVTAPRTRAVRVVILLAIALIAVVKIT